MTEKVVVDAIYEQGTLRPLEPLKLREHQRVQLQVVLVENAGAADADEMERVRAAALRALVSAGLLKPRPEGPTPPDPVPSEERERLAGLLGQAPGRPLSEIVIEERGEC